MQRLFLFCSFIVLATMVSAQDKIITVEQDTIECRIVSIGTENINYEQEVDAYMVGKSIPLEEVATYFRLPQSTKNSFFQSPERPWLLRFNPGGSYMPWLLEDTKENFRFEENFDKGFHLNASGHYLFSKYLGVGLQYSFLYSEIDGVFPSQRIVINPNYHFYLIESEKRKQYINYAGVSFISQQFLDRNKKLQLSETLSGGIITYRNESQIYSEFPERSYYYGYGKNTLITGETFGASIGLSLEYYLSPIVSIGIGGDFFFGLLKDSEADIEHKSTYDHYYYDYYQPVHYELDNPIKLSRLDYSLSLSFHF